MHVQLLAQAIRASKAGLGTVKPRSTVLVACLMQLIQDQQGLKERLVKAKNVLSIGKAALSSAVAAIVAADQQGGVIGLLSEQQIMDILKLDVVTKTVQIEARACDATLMIRKVHGNGCEMNRVRN